MTCCDSPDVVEASGSHVCCNCGLVYQEDRVFSDPPEFQLRERQCASYSDNSFVSGYGSQLGTDIGHSKDPRHSGIKRRNTYQTNNNSQTQNYQNSLYLRNLVSKSNVPEAIIIDTIDEFNRLNYCTQNGKKNSFKGNKKHGLRAVCLFYAFQRHGIVRQVKEIENMLELKEGVFNSSHKEYKELTRKIRGDRSYSGFQFKHDITNLCHSICITCGVPPRFEKLVLAIYKSVERYKLCKRNTVNSVLYGIVFYFFTETRVDATQVIDNGYIAEATMKRISKEIKKYEKLVLFYALNCIRAKNV